MANKTISITVDLDNLPQNADQYFMDILQNHLYAELLVKNKYNQAKTAEQLGLNRGTFRKRLKKFNML